MTNLLNLTHTTGPFAVGWAPAAAREPQYGSPKKLNVGPVTIGALAPTNDSRRLLPDRRYVGVAGAATASPSSLQP